MVPTAVICFLMAPKTSRFTISEFLFEFASEMVSKIRFIDVDRIANGERVDAKTWIFIGYDEATDPASRSQMLAVEAQLRNENRRVFNLPSRVLGRFELLKQLRVAGINTFDAHNADPTNMGSWRFPVFVRSRHTRERMSLLLNHRADAERLFATHPQFASDDAMVVEFLDTATKGGVYDGVFRTYSVLRVGSQYVARHILFSKNWSARTADIVDQALTSEELSFIGVRYPAPIPSEIVKAFEIAGIEYGRIDYGMYKDKPQIWEIDVNPLVVRRLSGVNSQRHRAQKISAMRVKAAFEAILR